jgi:hypothetical protein
MAVTLQEQVNSVEDERLVLGCESVSGPRIDFCAGGNIQFDLLGGRNWPVLLPVCQVRTADYSFDHENVNKIRTSVANTTIRSRGSKGAGSYVLAKDAVLAQAAREVSYELANDPSKCLLKPVSQKAISSLVRFSEPAE